MRKFDDGTAVAINLFAKSGKYLVDGNELYFTEHEVHFDVPPSNGEKEEISCDFAVEYKNPSVVRLTYLNEEKTAKISAENDMLVSFAVRNDTTALLDGERIKTSAPSERFPRAARAYYGVSEPILLKAGEHTVSSEKDFKYMPSVLVIGDFDQGASFDTPTNLHLERRAQKYRAGETLFGFGEVAFQTKIKIPPHASGIKLEGTKLYTELYINGEKIGEKICAPYDFYFSSEHCGEVTLEVVQKTSIAPVFGNTKHWDENVINPQWRGTPSTEKPLVGFEKISIIK